MKYLKLFTSHSDYNTAKDNLDKPNVSHCIEENEVHYNPYVHDYSKDYFTIKSLEDNNEIRFYATTSDIRKTVSISTDNGATWTEYVTPTTTYGVDPTAILNTGEKLLIKGENETYADSSNRHTFFSSKTCDLEGNIMSLIYGDNFATSTTLTQNYCFFAMFMGLKVVNADKLILAATTLSSSCYSQLFYDCTYLVKPPTLPATTLASSCYSSMFYGCTGIVTAPELPATTLVGGCYRWMFQDCTKLNYIKAMFTTTPSGSSPNYYTENWVKGVASSGTFVKNSAAQWDVSGVNGIPTNWTVQTAST